MGQLRISLRVEYDLGAGFVDLFAARVGDLATLIELSDDSPLIKGANLSDGNVGASQATLFDASVDTAHAAFKVGVIIVDPGNAYSDDADAPEVAIDFTGDGVDSPAVVVRREAPFFFSTSEAGGPAGSGLGSIDGRITKIRVRNNNSAPAAGNNKVRVILALFK